MSPTARSLALLKSRGAIAAVVEKWNSFARIRVDLFGFLDIVALEPGKTGLLGVQACVTGDQSKRLAKIALNANVAPWLAAGNRVAVWGWSKKGPRGKRKTWQLSETTIPTPTPGGAGA